MGEGRGIYSVAMFQSSENLWFSELFLCKHVGRRRGWGVLAFPIFIPGKMLKILERDVEFDLDPITPVQFYRFDQLGGDHLLLGKAAHFKQVGPGQNFLVLLFDRGSGFHQLPDPGPAATFLLSPVMTFPPRPAAR